MIKEIADFLHSFKNKTIETNILVNNHSKEIKDYAKSLIEKGFNKEYEENYLTILGYSFRLEDINQRIYFTFQEAVYAIDLDKLMKNSDSLKLNSIVYILVLDSLFDEYLSGKIDESLKQKALEVYKKIEDKKAQENKKYHMYQY
ncbi:MAG: hypothetical protein ACNI25_08875 [Halarcobacter sp.]